MSRRETADLLHSGMVRLMKRVALADRDAGVSPARLSVLAVLVFGGPRNVGGLSTMERVKPPTMTNLVKGMESEGLVRRSLVGEDARQSLISVTRKGETLLQKARQRRISVLAGLVDGISEKDHRVLLEASRLLLSMGEQPV